MYRKGAKTETSTIGYIYKTTCTINNKIYIGQHVATKFEPERYIGSGSIFKKALNKYGVKAFTCELICWANSIEELNKLEIFYINKFNSRDPEVGYNLCDGGKGGNLGYKFTEEQIEHLKETHMGHKNTPEAVKKQADKLRGRIWVHNETVRKMIQPDELLSYLQSGWIIGHGVKPYQSKAVICYETGEEFESRTAANKKYHGALKRCLLTEYWRTCAGYHWYFKSDTKRKQWLEQNISK